MSSQEEEGIGAEEIHNEDAHSPKKSKKKKSSAFISAEAEEDSSEEEEVGDKKSSKKSKHNKGESDSDEDGSDDDRYEMDGFITNEVEEEEEVESGEKRKRDDEDEKRPRKKKLKRLHQRSDERTELQQEIQDLLGTNEEEEEDLEDNRSEIGSIAGSTMSSRMRRGGGGDVASFLEETESQSGEEFGALLENLDRSGPAPAARARSKPKTSSFLRGFGIGLQSKEDEMDALEIFGHDDDFDFSGYQKGAAADGEGYEDRTPPDSENEFEPEDLHASPSRSARKKQLPPLKALEATFEPSEIAEQYLTERDDNIRNTDLPERWQLRFPSERGVPGDSDLMDESRWIFQQMSERHKWGLEGRAAPDSAKFIDAIKQILEYLIKDHYEIPFIAAYRKEYWEEMGLFAQSEIWRREVDQHLFGNFTSQNEINEKLEYARLSSMPEISVEDTKKEFRRLATQLTSQYLWTIYDLDLAFFTISERKAAMRRAFDQQRLESEHDPEAEKLPLLYLDLLERADSNEALSDLYDAFQFKFGSTSMAPVTKAGFKRRPVKRDLYNRARSAGLAKIAPEFGLTPIKFAENLDVGYAKHEVEDSSREPEMAAAMHAVPGGDLSEPEQVLAALRHMMAFEIAYEPAVRQKVRRVYEEKCVITARMTDKGQREIDSTHPYKRVSNIKEAPVHRFDDSSLFLELVKAEVDGLFAIEIDLGQSFERSEELIIEEVFKARTLFLTQNLSTLATRWNEERLEVLKETLKILRPSMVEHMKQKLSREAQQNVIRHCQQKLASTLMTAPWRPHIDRDGMAEEGADATRYKVLACVPGTNETATTFAIVDEDGEHIEHTTWKHSKQATQTPEGQKLWTEQCHALRDFIVIHRPRAIVVGCGSLAAQSVFREMEFLVRDMMDGRDIRTDGDLERRREDERNAANNLEVKFLPDDIARVYENSSHARKEFPDFPIPVRRCISLARRFQDPVMEIARLCNDSMDIAFLKLHPLQDMVDRPSRFEAFTQTMVDCVCRVGVDINRAVAHRHAASATLPFISGLGPRKAAFMLDQITALHGSRATCRKDLLEHKIVRRCVFWNCASFLKIVDNDVLDSTRIHFESYELALKMSISAMDGSSAGGASHKYVEEVMRNPEKLEDLDLDAYADELEKRRNKGKKRHTLEDIKNELQSPFGEIRMPYRDMTDDEKFYYLTGETEDTLAMGFVVPAVITRRDEDYDRWVVRLESGILGNLDSRRDGDDDRIPEFKIGARLSVKITEVRKKYLRVNCEAVPTEKPTVALTSAQALARRKLRQQIKNRVIDHPMFRNFSHSDAMDFLEGKEPGEYVIRPSSKGFDHIAITLKFYGDTLFHIDVLEKNKPNILSLGRELVVGNDTYEDLEEIIARHVDKIMQYASDLVSFEKYRDRSVEEIEAELREEKSKDPARIPYLIGLDTRGKPGRFNVYYLPGRTVRKELIYITPRGYHFRHGAVVTSPQKVVNEFKRNFQEMLKKTQSGGSRSTPDYPAGSRSSRDARATPRSTGSRTPSRTPESGGSSRDRERERERERYRERERSSRDEARKPSTPLPTASASSSGRSTPVKPIPSPAIPPVIPARSAPTGAVQVAAGEAEMELDESAAFSSQPSGPFMSQPVTGAAAFYSQPQNYGSQSARGPPPFAPPPAMPPPPPPQRAFSSQAQSSQSRNDFW